MKIVDQEFIAKYIREIEHFSVAAIFGILNGLIRPVQDSPWFCVIEFVISVTVATLVGIVSVDLGLSNAMGFSLTAVSALLSRDILATIIGFGDYVTENKQTLFTKLFDKLFNLGTSKLETKMNETEYPIDTDIKKD